MSERYSMRACKNGHIITPQQEISSDNSKFCEKCGAEVIDKCLSCGAKIPGSYEDFYIDIKNPSKFCNQCGKPYPWTSKRDMLGKVSEVIQNSTIDTKNKLEIKESIEKLSYNNLTEKEQISLAEKIKANYKQISKKAYSELKDILTEAMAKTAVKILEGK